MKLTIELTERITVIDGVPVRVWHGLTQSGVPCYVLVHRIAVANECDAAQFDEELIEMARPRTLSASLN